MDFTLTHQRLRGEDSRLWLGFHPHPDLPPSRGKGFLLSLVTAHRGERGLACGGQETGQVGGVGCEELGEALDFEGGVHAGAGGYVVEGEHG